MVAEVGTKKAAVSFIESLACMVCTAQKYNLKLHWYHPWQSLYKPDHYVLRVGDKSRIEENWKTAVPLVTVATLRLLELGALV